MFLMERGMLDPYTTHATPILLLCAPYNPTTIIVVPLHYNSYIRDVNWCPLVIPLGLLYIPRRYSHFNHILYCLGKSI